MPIAGYYLFSKTFDTISRGVRRWLAGNLSWDSVQVSKEDLMSIVDQEFEFNGPHVHGFGSIAEYSNFLDFYLTTVWQFIRGCSSIRALRLYKNGLGTPEVQKTHRICRHYSSQSIDEELKRLYSSVRKPELLDSSLISRDAFKYTLLSVGRLLGSYFNTHIGRDEREMQERKLMEEGVCNYLASKIAGLNLSRD